MKPKQLIKGLYWCGIQDPTLRIFDIIMMTEFGTTYNSYIIKGSEKIALVETAKIGFLTDFLKNVTDIVDVQRIHYLVVNHTEPDHSGSIKKLLEINPNLIIVGTMGAIGFLKHMLHQEFQSQVVKENDTLSLGDKTLTFMMLPNLHWPDTMFTYLVEDHVLFTCDSFGSHYSHPGILLSNLEDTDGHLRAYKYYFEMIIGPFKQPYMANALNRIKDLKIDMIATGHGPVIDCRIDELVKLYYQWVKVENPNKKKTVVMPYVSAYGYTKMLAEKIAQGVRESGDVAVKMFDMVGGDKKQVMAEIGFADGLLFGTPTILQEALEPIWDLTTSMYAPIHGGKLASAFGSYGWTGEGVPHIIERLKQLKMKVLDGYRVRFRPSDEELEGAYLFGYNFGCVLLGKENDKLAAPTAQEATMSAPAAPNKKRFVKCLVCGAIFEEGPERCPVCGVGKENFVYIDQTENGFKKNTKEVFVVLGQGVAAVTAAEEIRKRNETAKIILVGEENELPYNRPMLTKDFANSLDSEKIAIHDKEWYKTQHLQLLNKKVVFLDSVAKSVKFADGTTLSYDKCIYALGAISFIPPFTGANLNEVIAIRGIADVAKIDHLVTKKTKTSLEAVVIGGGVLGLEAAWELKKAGCHVTVLELAPRVMMRQLDETASLMMQNLASNQGIKVITNVKIEGMVGTTKVEGVKLADGTLFPADVVIISCGIRPNVGVAGSAGITLGRSIKVNEKMETNIPSIYACGDCAEFAGVNYALWSSSLEMGKIAGANAAGEEKLYVYENPPLAFFGMETSLYAVGDNGSNPQIKYQTVEFRDATKNTLEKYFFAADRLCGFTLIGDNSKMMKLTEALNKHLSFSELF